MIVSSTNLTFLCEKMDREIGRKKMHRLRCHRQMHSRFSLVCISVVCRNSDSDEISWKNIPFLHFLLLLRPRRGVRVPLRHSNVFSLVFHVSFLFDFLIQFVPFWIRHKGNRANEKYTKTYITQSRTHTRALVRLLTTTNFGWLGAFQARKRRETKTEWSEMQTRQQRRRRQPNE